MKRLLLARCKRMVKNVLENGVFVLTKIVIQLFILVIAEGATNYHFLLLITVKFPQMWL